MANSLNEVNLIGNLTHEPEIKETPNGHKVATISIATNRKWKQNNQVTEEVEYHRVVLWSGLAEIVEQYTSKGKKVFIKGRLKTRSWDDAQGVKRYTTEIVAESLILLGGGSGQSKQHESTIDEDFPEDDHQKAAREKAQKARKKLGDEDISIEDIPF